MCSVVNVKFNTNKPALDKDFSPIPLGLLDRYLYNLNFFFLGLSGGMKRPFNTPIVDSHLNMKIIWVNFCRGKTGHTMQHSYTDLGKVASCNLG